MAYEKIIEALKSKDYDFLRTNKQLKGNIILLGLGGSYAYGTNKEGSDIDIRGIALNSKENILLGQDFENIVDTNTDTTIYSFDKILSLLINCNPNTIEILGLDDDQYFYKSLIGQYLIDNKELFLTKRCIRSFSGYATAQMYRLQQKSLCALTKEEYNEHTAKVLRSMIERFDKKFGANVNCIIPYVDEDGELMLDLNFKKLPAESVSSMLNELNQTIRDYNTESKRNRKAETHNKIAKHSMHILRLYMMCIDILNEHEIHTHRTKEHDLLMSIRDGAYLDVDGKPTKEFFDIVKEYEDKYQQAAAHTTLPDDVDMEKINKLKCTVNEMIVTDSTSKAINKLGMTAKTPSNTDYGKGIIYE